MAEFAMVLPILVILVFGMIFAAFYAWRSVTADWGVFISGVGEGSYNTPATHIAKSSVLWSDVRSGISAGQDAPNKQVRSTIQINNSREWIFGITNTETHQGTSYFRLWRFYPGPGGGD